MKLKVWGSWVIISALAIIMGKHVDASTNLFIKPTHNTNLINEIDGETVVMGTVLAGESYKVVGEAGNQYYQIEFGTEKALVQKSDVKVSQTSLSKNKNDQNIAFKNQTIITTNKAVVYEEPTSTSNGFGIIARNIRYPIIAKIGTWYKVDFGNRFGYIPVSRTKIDNGIPIFMYHHMLKEKENKKYKNNSMVINVEAFSEQMMYLKKHGYRTIDLRDVDNYLHKRLNLTGTVAVITFDDGMKSSYTYAYPILKNNAFHATSFVITDRVMGRPINFEPNSFQYLSKPEITEMRDVFDFQSHTHHLHLRDKESNKPLLTIKSYGEIKMDLLKSKEVLEKDVKYLAYPWGQWNNTSIKALQDAGFRMAVTTETGNVKLGDNFYKLKRQGIGPYHDIEDFIAKLDGKY